MRGAPGSAWIMAAFTRLELLASVAVIAAAVAFLVFQIGMEASYGRAGTVRRIKCINNVKNIGLASRIFANDHDGRFPWDIDIPNNPGISNAVEIERLFLSFKDEILSPKAIACPSDFRQPSSEWQNLSRSNISYFIALAPSDTNTQSFLAGDRNLVTNGASLGPGRVKFTTGIPPSWDKSQHNQQGNVCMADGSVQQLSQSRLHEQWGSINLSNSPTFLFP